MMNTKSIRRAIKSSLRELVFHTNRAVKKLKRKFNGIDLNMVNWVIIVLAVLVLGTQTALGQTEDPQIDKSTVGVNFNSARVVTSTVPTVKIAKGESEAERAARIAAAAATAAKNPVKAITAPTAVATGKPDYGYLQALYKRAGDAYGVPWKLIEAVHQVETGKSGSTSRANPSGATGPMQFMPGTWRAYGVDGNGDGTTDISNLEDAVFGGAKYLAANGANRGEIDNALFRYNHSTAYVNMVKGIAASIQG